MKIEASFEAKCTQSSTKLDVNKKEVEEQGRKTLSSLDTKQHYCVYCRELDLQWQFLTNSHHSSM